MNAQQTLQDRIGFASVQFSRRALCLSSAFFVLIAFVHTSNAQGKGLLAHDINGFALDMTVQEVTTAAHRPLIPLGRGQYQVKVDGVDYDFGFSVLGHLFRIDSKQELGRFIPDGAFGATLTNQLSNKFGPPQTNQLPGGPAFWSFLEEYTDANGQKLNRETESLSAMLGGGYGQPVSLEMKLMDFRIVRRDLARANAAPRSRAQGDVKF